MTFFSKDHFFLGVFRCFCVPLFQYLLGPTPGLVVVVMGVGGVRFISQTISHEGSLEGNAERSTAGSANGGLGHSLEAPLGDILRKIHPAVYLLPTPWNSLCSSWVRSQGQALPQSWCGCFFPAWEAGRTSADPGISSCKHFPGSQS